jgi:hypothetical protein
MSPFPSGAPAYAEASGRRLGLRAGFVGALLFVG